MFYQPIAVEWRLSGGKKPYLTVGYSTKYGKLSLHYLDERVGDHSCKNKTWTTDHAQHPVGLSGWDRPFGGSRCSTKFHSGRDFRLEWFITSWLLPLLYGCFKIFLHSFFSIAAPSGFNQCRPVCGNEVRLEIRKYCNHSSHKISSYLCLARFNCFCHSFL